MIYYLGHGVEHNNYTHALLTEGNSVKKYNLELMANRIGRSRLIHVMFDCNRVYLNNLVPEQEKVYPKKSLFLYTYTTFAGRETKALNST